MQDVFVRDSVERGLETYFEWVQSIYITRAELFFDLCRLKKSTHITFIKLLSSVDISFSKKRLLLAFNWFSYYDVNKSLTTPKKAINLFRDNEIEEFKEFLCFIAPEWEIKQPFYDIDKKIRVLLVNEIKKITKDILEKKKLLDDLICSIKQSINDYKKTLPH